MFGSAFLANALHWREGRGEPRRLYKKSAWYTGCGGREGDKRNSEPGGSLRRRDWGLRRKELVEQKDNENGKEREGKKSQVGEKVWLRYVGKPPCSIRVREG